MLKIGITGQSGFIGSYIYNRLAIEREFFKIIEFKKSFFDKTNLLDSFVLDCDVIIHLAALNRHNDEDVLYKENINLSSLLIKSLNRKKKKTHIILSSSIQEDADNKYGESKKVSRLLFSKWAKETNNIFTGMIIPNVFGPFGKPFYNSVISTFSFQIANNESPKIINDSDLPLIYIGQLVSEIIKVIKNHTNNSSYIVDYSFKLKVSEVLSKLNDYKFKYLKKGEIPYLKTCFEKNLFNTFRSYINHEIFFPFKLNQYNDNRGSFVEVIRLGIGGQVSFSTTLPGITRGNHFHTRKIERFIVIKGEALIEMRKIGSKEKLEFYITQSWRGGAQN